MIMNKNAAAAKVLFHPVLTSLQSDTFCNAVADALCQPGITFSHSHCHKAAFDNVTSACWFGAYDWLSLSLLLALVTDTSQVSSCCR